MKIVTTKNPSFLKCFEQWEKSGKILQWGQGMQLGVRWRQKMAWKGRHDNKGSAGEGKNEKKNGHGTS